MQQLRVVGMEEGALLATSDDGQRFRIAIDADLQSILRAGPPEAAAEKRFAPREIQAHIRAGLTPDQVAALTGAPLEYISRFEGPVLAERAYVVDSALAVIVRTGTDDPTVPPSRFGAVIAARLSVLSATGARWASWKESHGWIVKLSFSLDSIDHDARWQYDPKKQTLQPLNSEAITLSQQAEPLSGDLHPRLRAVPADAPAAPSRFDSAAFSPGEGAELPLPDHVGGSGTPAAARASHPSALSAEPDGAGHSPRRETRTGSLPIIGREQPSRPEAGHTADLLEALRRRRGEREAARIDAGDAPVLPATTGAIRALNSARSAQRSRPVRREPDRNDSDTPTELPATADTSGPVAPPEPDAELRPRPMLVPQGYPPPVTPPIGPPKGPKRNRTTMPSWDEIVFGARPDDEDDPA